MLFKSDYRKYLDGIYWEQIDESVIDCYMTLSQLEKWVNQNKGEYIDCMEGSLIDSVVISCKRGIAWAMEEYLNSNSSIYHVYYSKESNDQLWDEWEKRKEAFENA